MGWIKSSGGGEITVLMFLLGFITAIVLCVVAIIWLCGKGVR